ncbi:MAG TPA: hypothetical protein VG844_00580, partial [Terracidiphilus sp.]|nr:hypothetical protein [Terracidiphilus sp.]
MEFALAAFFTLAALKTIPKAAAKGTPILFCTIVLLKTPVFTVIPVAKRLALRTEFSPFAFGA